MTPMPSLFVSHGAPTYALEPGLSGTQLRTLGETIAQPTAILIMSPHWMTPDIRVSISPQPRTLHDFSGFSPALYAVNYPVAGHPELAQRTIALLRSAGWPAQADSQWGLDHGAWVPLRHMYPEANIPVFQVSVPAYLDAVGAFKLGAALAPLAHEGVLIVGSGSLTHNIDEARAGADTAEVYVQEFVAWVRQAVISGDHNLLIRALELAPHAQRAHPTTEHLLPLFIAAGAASAPLPATVLEGGTRLGVLSMESYVFGIH